MTDPGITVLDEAVIAAGYLLVEAHREKPRNPERILAAREALEAARAARWPDADA